MIGTVEEELAACRERMRGATHAMRLHHAGPLMEPVTEDIERRFAFILKHKPAHERASRFYHMLPVSAEVYAEWRTRRDALYAERETRWAALDAEWRTRRDALTAEWEWRTRRDALDAEWRPKWDALVAEYHARVCTLADCAWDGRRIVFPEAPR